MNGLKQFLIWHMGSHLRVLSMRYPMNTNMTGFRCFSKIFVFLCFGQKLLQHWMGQVKKILKLLLSIQDISIYHRPCTRSRCVRVNFSTVGSIRVNFSTQYGPAGVGFAAAAGWNGVVSTVWTCCVRVNFSTVRTCYEGVNFSTVRTCYEGVNFSTVRTC